MKSRGLKYITDGLENLQFGKNHGHHFSHTNENSTEVGKFDPYADLDFTIPEFYERLENVILIKLHDFVNHDLVCVLGNFHALKLGSENFYSKVVQRILDRRNHLRPAEFIKFFNIFPQLEYIYENNMSDEIWNSY